MTHPLSTARQVSDAGLPFGSLIADESIGCEGRTVEMRGSRSIPHAAAVNVRAWLTAAIVCSSIAPATPSLAADEQPNRVRIEYGEPKTPEQEVLVGQMKELGALEKFQQIFSPFRLPIELTLMTKSCGKSNAWYERPIVTICYEYLQDIRKAMPTQQMPAEGIFKGISAGDAVFGQFFYVVAHEMGHAIFDLLDVPIFGRSEDAADAFAAYMMLELGKTDARRLILGAAYSYQDYIKIPNICAPLTAFADTHSAPMQRYYNLLCIAFGAAPQVFGGLVEDGYLPVSRSENCKMEFYEMNFAFQNTITRFLDPVLAKQVMDKTWVPPPGPAPPPSGLLWHPDD